jgi:hypothetical protein
MNAQVKKMAMGFGATISVIVGAFIVFLAALVVIFLASAPYVFFIAATLYLGRLMGWL